MNIILVSRRRKAPANLDLGNKRTLFSIIGLAGLAGIALVAVGVVATLLVANPGKGVLAELQQLHDQVGTQSTELVAVQANAQRQVNALATQLGKLQAQSMRINALGERLIEHGKLDDGEFNFDQPPALGGQENDVAEAKLLPADLEGDIAELATRFDRQQEQLRVLQDLLINHKVASRQRPTGWPVDNGYISSYYGKRIDPFDGHVAFHRGIDFAAKKGTLVHAVAEGIVTYTGRRTGYGKVVEIDHGNGYTTRYAHNSKILVRVGERVVVGQAVSKVGSTGRSTGPHCHLEVWYQGHSVNPLAYVRSQRG